MPTPITFWEFEKKILFFTDPFPPRLGALVKSRMGLNVDPPKKRRLRIFLEAHKRPPKTST